MERTYSLFDVFGGIRPMARSIGEPPSNVAAWKRVGRIPADKQRAVLQTARALGLNVTAEHVVFPLGRLNAAGASDVAEGFAIVCFDQAPGMKRAGDA